jgi:hypothetical protein
LQYLRSAHSRHRFPKRNVVRVYQPEVGKAEVRECARRRPDVQRVADRDQDDCQFAGDDMRMA